MAADQTLVEGAFRASRDYSSVVDQAKQSAVKNIVEGASNIGAKQQQQQQAEDIQRQKDLTQAQKLSLIHI